MFARALVSLNAHFQNLRMYAVSCINKMDR